MKALALGIVAALSLSGCVSSTRVTMVESGYEPGALGLAAIERGDWRIAEVNLQDMRGVKAGDPARLLNLGVVYMRTGRTNEAVQAWQAALAAKHHYLVETVDGRTESTDALAREALAHYAAASR